MKYGDYVGQQEYGESTSWREKSQEIRKLLKNKSTPNKFLGLWSGG